MRINQPVTQHEYSLADGDTIVSVTDLGARIRYCNATFIEASGYTKEELLGQPHNMIRHPDMPGEAFRDMWATIRSGEPWSGLVKNRRKNGDHYWVLANVTPILERGKVTGYMSVRTKPTRAEVSEVEGLYARMRAESEAKRKTLRLDKGYLVKTGLMGQLHRLQSGLSARVLIALTAAAAVAYASRWIPLAGLAANVAAAALTLATIGAALWWIRHQLIGELIAVIGFANTMAAGDLTGRLKAKRHDEIGRLRRALNQLNVNLRTVVSDVRREVEGVSTGAAEFARGSVDLAHRASSEAASLEETGASMEQINSTTRQTSEVARKANEFGAHASVAAKSGAETVKLMVSTMGEIETASKSITSIIGVIDSIAFQTNILALNAAVEAARAGDHGRSFAVVASEVRMLAKRSATAAKEIRELIGTASASVAKGSTLASRSGTSIEEVVHAVDKVVALFSEITHATAEQCSGISQVNAAISQLDGATQQNAALAEQSSAAAVALVQQADALQQAVEIFRLDARSSTLVASGGQHQEAQTSEARAA